jgi:membrane AbrB-like protein
MSSELALEPGRASPLLWLALLVVSALVTALFWSLSLPASLLIGPMVAAIGFGLMGVTLRLPAPAFGFAQVVIACLAASAVSQEVLVSFLDNWLIFSLSVVAILVASSAISWLSSMWGTLPGSTSVWGLAPGGASAMVLMAEAFGADPRLVAVMQYLRVIFVTAGASFMAGLWMDDPGAAHAIEWFPAIDAVPFASVFAVGAVGALLGRLLRLPGPFLLGPLILASILKLSGMVQFQLPEWLLASAYALIGWNVGLNFRRETIVLAWRALPQMIVSIVVLMVFCALIGWFLHINYGIDPMTAYLATSPGGLDSVVIIAAAARHVDLAFVITLQTMRLLLVMIFGAPLARLVSSRIRPRT